MGIVRKLSLLVGTAALVGLVTRPHAYSTPAAQHGVLATVGQTAPETPSASGHFLAWFAYDSAAVQQQAVAAFEHDFPTRVSILSSNPALEVSPVLPAYVLAIVVVLAACGYFLGERD